MSFYLRRCLAASVLVVALPGWAQQRLTLNEALRLATSRSQQLVAIDAAAASADEMAVAAGQLPDPVLKVGIDSVPVSGPDRFSLSGDFMTQQRIGISQELTRGEKRRLRVERVRQYAKRIEAEHDQALANIQRETALAWIDSRYARAQMQVVRGQVQEARLQIEGVQLAFRTGRGSQADVFAARAALAIVQDKLRELQRQAQAARLMLARWTGPLAEDAVPAGDVPWQDTTGAYDLAHDLERHPALLVLTAQIAAAETELRQADANRRPDVTVEASYQRRGPAFPDLFSLGISVPLPIAPGARQDREVGAKLAALEELRARYQDALAAEDARVRVLVNDWEAGKQRLANLRAELLPAVNNRTEGALAAYRSGKGDLASVLAARRDELDARLQVLQLEMETARLWGQLQFYLPQHAAGTENRS